MGKATNKYFKILTLKVMPFRTNILYPFGSIRGFSSSVSGLALAPGFVAILQEARLGEGHIRCRKGDMEVVGSQEYSCKGASEATLDGERFLFRAGSGGDDDSETRLYMSDDDGATWIEASEPEGPFGGGTRFDTPSDAPISFVVLRDRGYDPADAPSDLLVIQNGNSSPRMFGRAAHGSSVFPEGTFGMSKITSPDTPEDSSEASIVNSLGNYFDIKSGGWTFATSANILLSGGGGSAGQCVLGLSVQTPVISSEVATAVAPTQIDFSSVGQLIFLVHELDEGFWKAITVEIGDGLNWDILISPGKVASNIYLQLADIPGFGGTFYQLGLPLDPSSMSCDLTAIDRLRFSWLGDGPLTTFDGTIYAVIASGATPGGSQFAFSYGQTDGRTIGPSGLKQYPRSPTSSSYGGANDTPISIVDDPRFFFNYTAKTYNPSADQASKGVDRLHIYRRLPGESECHWIGSQRLTHWDGTDWIFESGTAGGLIDVTIPQGDSTIEVLNLSAPDAATLSMPVGTAMAAINGRFFVGSGADLYFSEFNLPFFFRKAVRFIDASKPDPTSGGSVAFDGDTVQAIVPMGSLAGAAESLQSPIVGAATLHVLTVNNLHQLSGFDASSLSRPIPVAPYGTRSPFSVGRSNMGFYWLDQRGQICRWSRSGIDRPSVAIVDDITTSIPDALKAYAFGACVNDRYYLALGSTNATSNDRILVWYERSQTFESLDNVGAENAWALVPYYVNGKVRLYRFTESELYEHESEDSEANVDFKIVFREYTAGDLSNGPKRLETGAMTVWVDGSADGYTLTCKRLDPSTGATATGTIEVGSAPRAIYVDTPSTGLAGDSIQPSIEGSVPGGTKFHGVWLNMSSAPSGAIGS